MKDLEVSDLQAKIDKLEAGMPDRPWQEHNRLELYQKVALRTLQVANDKKDQPLQNLLERVGYPIDQNPSVIGDNAFTNKFLDKSENPPVKRPSAPLRINPASNCCRKFEQSSEKGILIQWRPV